MIEHRGERRASGGGIVRGIVVAMLVQACLGVAPIALALMGRLMLPGLPVPSRLRRHLDRPHFSAEPVR